MKRLLLLGGGHAHVQVLRALARERLPGAQVMLVTPYPQLTYSGMVPGWLAGHYDADDCVIPLAPLAARAGVSLHLASVIGLDAAAREAALSDGSRASAEVISIDTGPVMDRDAIPGAREHGLFVRPIEAFAALWPVLLELAEQRASSVVVVGGGAGGVELAMAVQHRLRQRVRVSLVSGGPPPLSALSAAAQRLARRALLARGITLFEDTCTAIAADHVQLGRGMRLQCDAPLLAIGTSAPAWLQGSGLALDERGFIATGPTLQSSSHAHVFAAGDVASRSDAPRPKSGVYAVRAGAPLALNLRRHLAGGRLQSWHPQPRALNLLACGERQAIAAWGPLALQGAWVWRWKDRIDRAFVAGFRG